MNKILNDMKIEITKRIEQVEVIDVELPYYYEHDLSSDHGDYIIYGKIEENVCTTILEDNDGGEIKYQIKKEEHSSIKNSGLASYFNKEYKSTENKFEAVKERCKTFLNGF